MTPSSKSPVRNLQRPPSMTCRTGGSSHTSIHARELKFGTQVKNHISWWSMMSRMTPSSKYPVRNHQCPPSMTSRTRCSWHTSIHARELKFGAQVKNHISWWSIMSRMKILFCCRKSLGNSGKTIISKQTFFPKLHCIFRISSLSTFFNLFCTLKISAGRLRFKVFSCLRNNIFRCDSISRTDHVCLCVCLSVPISLQRPISQPNVVRSLWNFQYNFTLVYQDDL